MIRKYQGAGNITYTDADREKWARNAREYDPTTLDYWKRVTGSGIDELKKIINTPGMQILMGAGAAGVLSKVGQSLYGLYKVSKYLPTPRVQRSLPAPRAQRSLPATTTRNVPTTTTTRNVPTTTTRNVPATTTRNLPATTTRNVPATTTRNVPARTSKNVPATTRTQKNVPATTTKNLPEKNTAVVKVTETITPAYVAGPRQITTRQPWQQALLIPTDTPSSRGGRLAGAGAGGGWDDSTDSIKDKKTDRHNIVVPVVTVNGTPQSPEQSEQSNVATRAQTPISSQPISVVLDPSSQASFAPDVTEIDAQLHVPISHYDRKTTRQLIRAKGLNPYHMGSLQRRQLRKYLNGELTEDQVSPTVLAMAQQALEPDNKVWNNYYPGNKPRSGIIHDVGEFLRPVVDRFGGTLTINDEFVR